MQPVKALPDHCAFCFRTIIATLQRQPAPAWPEHLPSANCPLFVTWETGPDEDLRGCIGTFGHSDLKTTLPKYAKIAAFEDTRFQPIKMSEVPTLTCKVSFLTDFEPNLKALDWKVGVHGIIIDFAKSGQNYNATFLPSVAADHNWDQKTTLQHLISKAGYKGTLDSVIDSISLTRYQSSVAKMSYQQFSTIQ